MFPSHCLPFSGRLSAGQDGRDKLPLTFAGNIIPRIAHLYNAAMERDFALASIPSEIFAGRHRNLSLTKSGPASRTWILEPWRPRLIIASALCRVVILPEDAYRHWRKQFDTGTGKIM